MQDIIVNQMEYGQLKEAERLWNKWQDRYDVVLPVNFDRFKVGFEEDNNFTTCLLAKEGIYGTEVVLGISKRNPTDRKDGAIGRNIAFARALRKVFFVRTGLWSGRAFCIHKAPELAPDASISSQGYKLPF